MTTAEVLKELRADKDKSVQQVVYGLKTKTGYTISRESLEKWEKGTRTPNAEGIIALCKYYGVTADYLLGYSQIRQDENLENDLALVLNLSNEDDSVDGTKAVKNLIKLSDLESGHGAEILRDILCSDNLFGILLLLFDTKTELARLYRQIENCGTGSQRERRAIEHNAMIAKGYVVDTIEKLLPALYALLGYDKFDELLKGSDTDAE